MKSALIALDPTSLDQAAFGRLSGVIRFLQDRAFLPRLEIAAVLHPSLYTVTLGIYRTEKRRLKKDSLAALSQKCAGRFDFESVHVLDSDSSDKGANMRRLSRFAKRRGSAMLIVGSNDRSGLPLWFLGSFSETAALAADLPVLIIKPQVKPSDFSAKPSIVLCVDADAPPSKHDIQWLAEAARPLDAFVHLLYVLPRQRSLLSKLYLRKLKGNSVKILTDLRMAFQKLGVRSRATLLGETESVAHAVTDYAESCDAWLLAVTAPRRSTARKILLGSTARRILALTKRPFLALRFH